MHDHLIYRVHTNHCCNKMKRFSLDENKTEHTVLVKYIRQEHSYEIDVHFRDIFLHVQDFENVMDELD